MRAVEIVSIILLLLTPISYLPAWHRIHKCQSSAGISLVSTCLLALIAQGQAATFCLLWSHAAEYDHGKPVHLQPSLLDCLNYAQIVAQWLCSLTTLALVCRHYPLIGDNAEDVELVDNELILEAGRQQDRSVYTALAIVIVHALLMCIAIPMDHPKILNRLFLQVNNGFATPLWTGLLMVAMSLQLAQTFRASAEASSLSSATLALQVVLSLALAVLWPWRFEVPEEWLTCCGDGAVAWLVTWYPWVGWACVNSDLMSIGQAAVLLVLQRRRTDHIALE